MMDYQGIQIQLIENPAIDSDYYNKGLPHTTDILLILVTKVEEIEKIKKYLTKSPAKQIIVFNKIDYLSENEKRRIAATLQSKKYNFVLISTKTQEGIEELKEKLFNNLDHLKI